MSAFDYPRMAAQALALLRRFGQSGVLRKRQALAYDPAAAMIGAQWQPHGCTLFVSDYQAREIDGTRILAGDQKILMASNVPQPAAGDVVEMANGTKWDVVNVSVIAPAGMAVLFEVQGRGAA